MTTLAMSQEVAQCKSRRVGSLSDAEKLVVTTVISRKRRKVNSVYTKPVSVRVNLRWSSDRCIMIGCQPSTNTKHFRYD